MVLQLVVLDDGEKYEIAVSYSTIIGTGVLSLIICCARAFGVDDWACLVALCFTTSFNGIGVAIVATGAGRHTAHVSKPELATWFKLYYTCTCLSLVIAFAVKTSLLLYLRRLFPTSYIRRIVTGLLVFMTLITFPLAFADAFQCNPPRYVYELQFVTAQDRAQHCLPANVVYSIFLFQAILLLVIDITILLLPVPVVWSLKLKKGKGIVVLLVFVPGMCLPPPFLEDDPFMPLFAIAVIACIAPTLRFQSLEFLKTQDSDITCKRNHGSPQRFRAYWQSVEYNLGMIAGSLGCLQPLFRRIHAIGKTYLQSPRLPSYKLVDSTDWHQRPLRNQFRVQGDSILDTAREAEPDA
ncbi:hypothetical protein GGR57DRAFT_518686 [Xylariaceae sp. FL1272]|nr:hypothetical protein GGR57DRAFT_518686 [Xylariaceae sp. FL1272]